MPIPSPKGRREQDDFISSCMSNEVMNDEFPQANQRAAVCHSKCRQTKNWEEALEEIESEPYIIY